jgi:hypothetical protein
LAEPTNIDSPGQPSQPPISPPVANSGRWRRLRELLSKDWFIGFLSGVAATLLGALLAVLWDVYKSSADEVRNQGIAMDSVVDELLYNRGTAQHNIRLLTSELYHLKSQRTTITPLAPLRVGAFETLRVATPRLFLDRKRHWQLRDLSHSTFYLNEGIRSRDAYRIGTHDQGPGYLHRLEAIDDELCRGLMGLERMIIKMGEAIPEYQGAARGEGFVREQLTHTRMAGDSSPLVPVCQGPLPVDGPPTAK